MKIKVIDASTKKPLINTKVSLQMKGANSGFLTLTTDATGLLLLDDKYDGHQMTPAAGGGQGPWVTVAESAVLLVPAKQQKTTTTK